MRLRSLLGRGAVLGCALAFLPAQAALAATPSTGLDSGSGSGYDSSFGPGPGSGSGVGPDSGFGSGTPATGYDISWPECGGALPPPSGIAVVGVDDGHPFSQNPCLQQEEAWALGAGQRAQYMVLDSPVGWSTPNALQYADHGPAGDCTAAQYDCQSYNWGYNAAYAAVQFADSQGANSEQWWLDVELPKSTSINPAGPNCDAPNFWVCDTQLNSLVMQAAVTALHEQGKDVGVYSTQSQWQKITGGLSLSVPIWIAGYDKPPATYCDPANASSYWFAQGAPTMVQSQPATFDPDTDC